jgi:hypothetical protein
MAVIAPTARPVAASSETCAGLACRTRIAIRGKASKASQVPIVLVA